MSEAITPLPLHVFMSSTGETLRLPLFVYLFICLFIRDVLTDIVDRAIRRRVVGCLVNNCSYQRHNDVSVDDGPHIRR
jgi:uncharacterized membrane protein YcfT